MLENKEIIKSLKNSISIIEYNKEKIEKEYHIIIGKMLGYPKCCVDNFNGDKIFNENDCFLGTGFRPCIECSKLGKNKIIKKINENRLIKEKFPIQNGSFYEEIKNIECFTEEDKELVKKFSSYSKYISKIGGIIFEIEGVNFRKIEDR